MADENLQEEPVFTDGMTKIASNWSSKTDEEKVAIFKSTDTNKEATINDLSKISPFIAHMYYED